MVQLMASFQIGKVEDFTEEEYGPLPKRSRFVPANRNQRGPNNEFVPPVLYNPLDEPSPLGLRLRKSPSLLDLIQSKLSQGSTSVSVSVSSSDVVDSDNKANMKGVSASVANDKLKASNFPASLLRIGNWEYISKYEGDLVAKCYFAKHKLVWEVLEGGLKSKIEIQWSDITALKADCPDDRPGTLTIVLARQPSYFRETNPQPRKHTLWQATSDFTNGQASKNKKHFIQCPPGVLNKHYEKLIQCDLRLSTLSQQPEIVIDSPYFETKTPVSENLDESKDDECNQLPALAKGSTSGIEDAAPTGSVQLYPFDLGQSSMEAQHVSKREAPSPSSVMDTLAIEGNRTLPEKDSDVQKTRRETMEVLGMRRSMSINDFVNHIGNCISEQVTCGSLPSDKALECQDTLENIAQILLNDSSPSTGLDEKSLLRKVDSLCCLLQDPALASDAQANGENMSQNLLTDTQSAMCLDEKSLMKKVNSLRCLLQDPAMVSGTQLCGENRHESIGHGKNVSFTFPDEYAYGKVSDTVKSSGGNSTADAPPMQRKDSFSDLLLNLPRIASLPKFLFGITEDDEYQGL